VIERRDVEFEVDTKSRMASGAFDIVIGDVERLSGRSPRPLRGILTNRFAPRGGKPSGAQGIQA
jgi:hypothetical protein